MKLLEDITPPSIYHGCSTWKTFWEEKFTGKEDLFLSMTKTNYGHQKVREHQDIKGRDNCVTLNTSEKFDSLNKTETTYSESKGKLGISGKGLVTALALKTKARSKNIKRQGMSSEMSV